MNNRHFAIQVNDIDGKSHAQSMNAVAGNNPEARTITEVTRSQSKQSTQPGPVRVGNSQSRGEVRLAGVVEGSSLRGKNRHKCKRSPSSCGCLLRLLASARDGAELPDQFDNSRADRDKNNRRQNKYHQWGDHLDRGFGRLLFGPLPAFRAEGVGMHSEGLRDAGAEAVSL